MGFDFDGKYHKHHRDAFYKGTCDEGVKKLAELCGWEVRLKVIHTVILFTKYFSLKEKKVDVKELLNEEDSVKQNKEKKEGLKDKDNKENLINRVTNFEESKESKESKKIEEKTISEEKRTSGKSTL